MLQNIINQQKSAESFKSLGVNATELYDYLLTNVKGKARKALSYLLAVSNKHHTIYVSQSTIARKIGSCRETANRAVAYLARMGIITKRYRHMTTCLYGIHPTFLDPEVRDELKTLFKCFFFLNISLLTSLGFRNEQLEKDSYIYRQKSSQTEMSHKEIIRNNNIRLYTTGNHKPPGGLSPGLAQSDRSFVNKSTCPRRGIMTKRIKTLKLTRAGEIKVSPFPPQAIAEADKQLRNHNKPVKDIFRLYTTFCRAYCEQHGLKIEWRNMFSQLTREGFDNDAPGINPKDPYIYEERAIDPATPTSGKAPRIDPANVGHSIYHNAQTPAKREPETLERLNASKAKLSSLRESSDPFMKDMASIIGSIMDCIKPKL
jgi:hypothetical protein